MAKMLKKYERMLQSGEYMNERELCNALGLNYDDLYEDEHNDDDDLPSYRTTRTRSGSMAPKKKNDRRR